MGRKKNKVWETPSNPHFTWDHVKIEVLMDIRDELKQLNCIFTCENFTGMTHTLKRIDNRLRKRFARKRVLPHGSPKQPKQKGKR